MTIQYDTCKKCSEVGVKISRTEGYYTFKKGFVGKTVRVWIAPKEQVLDSVCKFCGFDNKEEVVMKEREYLFKVITERFE